MYFFVNLELTIMRLLKGTQMFCISTHVSIMAAKAIMKGFQGYSQNLPAIRGSSPRKLLSIRRPHPAFCPRPPWRCCRFRHDHTSRAIE